MNSVEERAAKQEIAELLVRYATSIDRRDWERFRTCFAEACDVVYESAGAWSSAEEITAFMIDAHAAMGHTLHRVSTIDVAVMDAGAQAQCYVDAVLMAPDGRSGINSIGWYDDELARTAAGWQIVRRRFTPVRLVALGSEGDLLAP